MRTRGRVGLVAAVAVAAGIGAVALVGAPTVQAQAGPHLSANGHLGPGDGMWRPPADGQPPTAVAPGWGESSGWAYDAVPFSFTVAANGAGGAVSHSPRAWNLVASRPGEGAPVPVRVCIYAGRLNAASPLTGALACDTANPATTNPDQRVARIPAVTLAEGQCYTAVVSSVDPLQQLDYALRATATVAANEDVTVAHPASCGAVAARTATKVEAEPVVLSLDEFSINLPNLRATLTTAGGAPLAGQPIVFEAAGNEVCRATTNGEGTATCTGLVESLTAILSFGYTATFAGTSVYSPSSGSGGLL